MFIGCIYDGAGNGRGVNIELLKLSWLDANGSTTQYSNYATGKIKITDELFKVPSTYVCHGLEYKSKCEEFEDCVSTYFDFDLKDEQLFFNYTKVDTSLITCTLSLAVEVTCTSTWGIKYLFPQNWFIDLKYFIASKTFVVKQDAQDTQDTQDTDSCYEINVGPILFTFVFVVMVPYLLFCWDAFCAWYWRRNTNIKDDDDEYSDEDSDEDELL